MDESLVIGIDLGTTNSCVAYFSENVIHIVENKEGGRTTPSFVFFTDEGSVIVGKYAKHMALLKTENGICEIKRLIGRSYNDTNLQDNLVYLPYNVKQISGVPTVSVYSKSGPLESTPDEISAHILKKLKTDTEDKLGRPVDKLVLTVPAYFNVSQRKATLEAAKNAGFTVLKLLNEPTAAALNFYLENKSEGEAYSLVYDLGGGTFDVAIVKKDDQGIEIISVDGDTHLGGHDFDRLIAEYVLEVLLRKYDCNPQDDKRSMRILQSKCEEAKKVLSTVEETIIILEGFFQQNHTLEVSLTRAQFEFMAETLFIRTMDITRRCLKNSKLSKKQITHVILSGGSTRIPRVQSMISQVFDGKSLCKFLNVDECVAKGAAVQAAMLSKNPKQYIPNMTVTDVIPLSLGTNLWGNRMSMMIPKNSPIPTSYNQVQVLVVNNQESTKIDIFEGERADVRKNYYLGTLVIDKLRQAPPRQCKIMVTMNVDQNGILTVSAKEMHKDNRRELEVIYNRSYKNEMEIENAIRDAAENKEEDENFLRCAKKKCYLRDYCESIKYNLKEKDLLQQHEHIYERCKEIRKMLRSLELEDEGMVEQIIEEIEQKCASLATQHDFKYMPNK